jgi:endonuclease/exonuclease/phosphatase family metal-dependent hydrolase
MKKRVARLISLEGLSVGYCVVLLLTLFAVTWRAESWVALAILMFAPPVGYIAPFCILSPLMLWRRKWRHLVLHLVCVGIVLFGFMRYHTHRSGPQKAGSVTVITHNIGQGAREAFAEYFPAEDPDIVILQDAGHRRELLAKRFPKHRIKALDQFLILTPHTILRADLLNDLRWRGRVVAARFELVVDGRETVVYNVHMPTPRSSLNRVFSPRVWLEIAGVADASTEGFPSYRAWIDARVALANELADILSRENLPFIVGGDFNMPDHGKAYRMFARKMTDAFAASGNGWGFTFPGSRDSRAAAFLGPWLRIDYLFAGRGWKPVDCRTADDPRSQHRAVFARFEPIP